MGQTRKHVIAVYGGKKTGKSRTIKQVFQILKQRYNEHVEYFENEDDVTAVFRIQGKIVGIESQGDANSRQMQSMAEFATMGCDVILVASRSRGITVDAIEALQPDYLIDWINKAPYFDPDHQDDTNHALSTRLITMIEDYVNQ